MATKSSASAPSSLRRKTKTEKNSPQVQYICTVHGSRQMGRGEGCIGNLPPKPLLMKLFAAKELAAYSGYASTRKVKMPVKTRRVLHGFQAVSYCKDTCFGATTTCMSCET
jgi:hypothetical protein